MKSVSICSRLVANFEGYTPVSAWDVNAWRLGYGSDTEGPDQIKVTKGMMTTRERALANLAARLPEFENEIVKQVTQAAWDKCGPLTQAALISFGYNYGELTPTLQHAVMSGGDISGAIAARAVDNDGINKTRRTIEAAFAAVGG